MALDNKKQTPSATEGVFQIVFATNNPGKMVELHPLFAAAGYTARSLAELGVRYEAVEDGVTFAENAVKKAVGCAEALREHHLFLPGRTVTLADDSGLCIDALDGRPGVYSARFLGEDTPYTVKNAQLLAMLENVPEERRTARFACVIACALPDGRTLTAEGFVEGIIAREPRGANGFGYDPVFYLPEYGLTTAELPPEEKNRISHRARAVQAMLAMLNDL